MFLPRGRARPVVFLLLASPVIAELLWGALVAAARRVAPARSQPQGRLPAPPRLALLAAGAALIWFAILLLAVGQQVIGWLPWPVPLVLIAAAVAAGARWAWHRPVPGDAQLVAACTGALAVQAAAGFFTGLHGPVNIAGKAVLNVVALAVLALLWRRAAGAVRPRSRPAARPARPAGPDHRW